jgi:tetratricopeptide (TPR) repeat protein
VALVSKNESDKALAAFDKAIEFDPKATLAYYHRANLAYGKQQYDKALEDYNTVIRNDPGFDWAYHVRGMDLLPQEGLRQGPGGLRGRDRAGPDRDRVLP